MPGYWRRPITRMYNYNLDLGENYYSHVRDHVSNDRRDRGETPGALSFSERLSRRYCGDDRVGGGQARWRTGYVEDMGGMGGVGIGRWRSGKVEMEVGVDRDRGLEVTSENKYY